jgi:pSer/pThr/pTyr-binding forkhead associated (FHA) protein
MSDRAAHPHRHSPAELRERLAAETAGTPFLVWREERGRQRILQLEGTRVTIGRAAGSDVWLPWDERVSRVHAALVRTGPAWTVLDDGLSANGTFRNGERVLGRRRLADRDELRCGGTAVVFHSPAVPKLPTTVDEPEAALALSDTQRRVLVALCRPFRDGAAFAIPATNVEIASEVFLGVDAVKAQLGALFAKLGLTGVPRTQKRMQLVELAFQTGLVTRRDLA